MEELIHNGTMLSEDHRKDLGRKPVAGWEFRITEGVESAEEGS